MTPPHGYGYPGIPVSFLAAKESATDRSPWRIDRMVFTSTSSYRSSAEMARSAGALMHYSTYRVILSNMFIDPTYFIFAYLHFNLRERMIMKTIRELSVEYLAFIRQRVRENTYEGYVSSINLYVVPKWGDFCVDGIPRQEVRKWVDDFDKTGAAYKAFKCLRQIIRWAISELEMDVKDPTVGGFPGKLKQRPNPKVLTVEQVHERIKGFKNSKWEPIVLLMHSLGLRPGEAMGLKWKKIDWKTGQVTIDVSLQHTKSGIIEYPTKTSKSTRTLVLPNRIRKRMKKIWKKRGKPNGRIIGKESPRIVSSEIRIFARKHGLPECSMYNMRHTWATLMIESNVPIAKVSMMMGHSDIKITYSHYVVPTTKDMESMAEVWDNLF